METWFWILIKQYGLPIALVAFFIWRDWKRETGMTNRINKLQDEIRDILKDLVTKCTAALVDNTNAMNKLIETLDRRPCFLYSLCENGKEWKLTPVEKKRND